MLATPAGKADHLVDRGPVLPLQALDDRQAGLDLVDAAGADRQPLPIVAKGQGEVVELRSHRSQALDRRGQSRIDRDQLVEALLDLGQRAQNRSLFLEEQRVAFLGQGGQPAHVGLHDLLAPQVFFFTARKAGLLDLSGLELEGLAAPFGLAPVPPQLFESGHRLLPGPVGATDEGEVSVQARVGIEAGKMGGRVQQALRLVLAVDEGEVRREIAEHVQGNHRAVDRRPALAAGQDLAADHHLGPLGGKTQGAEDGFGGRQINEGLDHGAILARPDDLGGGARSQDQSERVHENRLPGACLAGEDRKAAVQIQRCLGYDRNVADFE